MDVRELRDALRSTGFTGFVGAWNARRICIPLPCAYFAGAERVLGGMTRSVAAPFARYLLPTVMVLAVK
ncbi:MAG: hypothetical protein M3Q11_01055 [Pseudomonadota bacterium]|nr:hypothetical protein [Pseudomonadota bacterium]